MLLKINDLKWPQMTSEVKGLREISSLVSIAKLAFSIKFARIYGYSALTANVQWPPLIPESSGPAIFSVISGNPLKPLTFTSKLGFGVSKISVISEHRIYILKMIQQVSYPYSFFSIRIWFLYFNSNFKSTLTCCRAKGKGKIGSRVRFPWLHLRNNLRHNSRIVAQWCYAYKAE